MKPPPKPISKIHICRCPQCREGATPVRTWGVDREVFTVTKEHEMINLFSSLLNRQQRRLYLALESHRMGGGGDTALEQITGTDAQTIGLARREFDRILATGLITPDGKGGGISLEEKYPTLVATLERMLQDEIAGDPMNKRVWVRTSTYKLCERLSASGYHCGTTSLAKVLRKMGFSPKTSKEKPIRREDPGRDEQFRYISSQRRAFTAAGLPIISVDTKKKELIGEFKRKGRVWRREAEQGHSYTHLSMAVCRAVPYGIYDVTRNEGYVFVGTSNETPEFAVEAIRKWWNRAGTFKYKGAKRLLILADCGGSNGRRVKGWKQQLQEKISDPYGLEVTVCHYPPGCSEWNPIERRLFSQISQNWAGVPLRSLEVMLGYIRGTTTKTGLKVKAYLHKGTYQTGRKVLRKELEQLNLQPHTVCPEWNYTISPR